MTDVHSATTPVQDPASGDRRNRPGRPDRPLEVAVRNLAGHQLDDRVCRGERVHAVTVDVVERFVARGELAPGRYLLTLPRLGAAPDLDPPATVTEVGIVGGDVLVLISAEPQVDGAAGHNEYEGPGRAAR